MEKKSNIFIKILKSIVSILIILFFILITWMLIDRITNYNFPIFGYRFSVIASPSMSEVHKDNEQFLNEHDDRYYVDDLIITKTVYSLEDLKVYDVISFIDNNERLICHRIVEIDYEDNIIWTQGDANNVRDGVISFEDVKGLVIGRISKVGAITLYVISPYGMLGISIALVIIFTAMLILEIDKSKKDKLSLNNNKNNDINNKTNISLNYTTDGNNSYHDDSDKPFTIGMDLTPQGKDILNKDKKE